MKRAQTVALIAALYLVSNAPAYSQGDIFGFLQNIAGQYALSWTDLDNRVSQLETQINNASLGAKITPTQLADFRAEVVKLRQDMDTARAGGRRLGVQQSITFSNQVNLIGQELAAAIEHRITTLPNIDAEQLSLTTQINAAASSGIISTQTAAELRAEMQQIATMIATFKADTGGNLTPRQVELLSQRLATVKARLDQQTSFGQNTNPTLNEQRAAVEARITQSLAAGRITAAEANVWRNELAAIQAQQQAFIAASPRGRLTGTQVLTLANRLDALDDQISAKVGFPGGTVIGASTAELDALRSQASSRINTLVTQGKLTQTTAAELLQDLDRIAQLQAAYAAAVGGITAKQITSLKNDLASLNTRIDTRVAAGTGTTTGGTTGGTTTAINLPVIAQRSFADVTGYWGEPYVIELASRDVIGGFPNGTFRPNDEITREQFAAIVVKALKLPTAVSGGKVFIDVPSTRWSAPAIAAASNAGLIGGFPDGTFKPADNITRAQALVILSKALGSATAAGNALASYSDNAAVPTWAETAVANAANAKIIVNFPNPAQIRPNATATRGEVAALMYQTLNALGANLPPLRIGVMTGNM
jgi:polyhydroxyalkanoate synthesis regulator phasin